MPTPETTPLCIASLNGLETPEFPLVLLAKAADLPATLPWMVLLELAPPLLITPDEAWVRRVGTFGEVILSPDGDLSALVGDIL